MKIPDFQEHLYTWPLPIVTGEPGKIKHPNRAFAYNAKPPVNANHHTCTLRAVRRRT